MATRLSVIAVLTLMCGILAAQQRFDMLVREDFFAGFAGNADRLAKGMKAAEDALEKNARHAEAKVWHGGGALFKSGQAFQAGDVKNGMRLWQEGLAEMAEAVQLEPDNLGVLIPRGAILITASRQTPPDMGRPILETGVADFEKVLEIQAPTLAGRSVHARGELLTGLADGWDRLGDSARARRYFERIASELKGTNYAQRAAAWIEGRPEVKSPRYFDCVGCHVE
jgi:hypothetical protein